MENNETKNVELSGEPRVILCEDGKYRWTHEFNMYGNPTVFFTCAKVVLISLAIVFAFVVLISLGDRNFLFEGLFETLKVFGILAAVLVVICALAYLIVAARYKGKYIVLFEMDEKGVNHIQLDSQVDSFKALGWLGIMAGGGAGSVSTVSSNILAMTRNSLWSPYIDVRKMKVYKKRNVIKLNGILRHNQVYVGDADFDFVCTYISERVRKSREERKKKDK